MMSSSATASGVDVGRVDCLPACGQLGEAMQDVVGDAVAFLLAKQDLAREASVLGIVGEQIPQQQRTALDVAAGLLEERQHLGIGMATAAEHHSQPSPPRGATGRDSHLDNRSAGGTLPMLPPRGSVAVPGSLTRRRARSAPR